MSNRFLNIRVTGANRNKLGAVAIYYIAVAEFCFAILRNETPFFIALHRIIDGTIDADRMDYIVRDTRNSGVDWGTIPYKRLLESCKLEKRQYGDDYRYCVAFPKKMTEHIDDLLITGNNDGMIDKHKEVLHQNFKMKDLGELRYFLGIEVLRSSKGIILLSMKTTCF